MHAHAHHALLHVEGREAQEHEDGDVVERESDVEVGIGLIQFNFRSADLLPTFS